MGGDAGALGNRRVDERPEDVSVAVEVGAGAFNAALLVDSLENFGRGDALGAPFFVESQGGEFIAPGLFAHGRNARAGEFALKARIHLDRKIKVLVRDEWDGVVGVFAGVPGEVGRLILRG